MKGRDVPDNCLSSPMWETEREESRPRRDQQRGPRKRRPRQRVNKEVQLMRDQWHHRPDDATRVVSRGEPARKRKTVASQKPRLAPT